ncbi:GlsB/YeaQ/YmgE family stress response membrane protein [Undibacterium sp. Tian12W]|uniref:GlsB/YeaQ/YmgE family stress response membrane protein n=1 Tax=Undibacterium sp. Tian12W TaxID=3413054 RepID=UPI003BF3185B
MELIFWIFVGGIVGWIILTTSTGDHQNIYLNVLVGIAGGLIIGCLMPSYLNVDTPYNGGFDFQALGSLIVGALAILSVASLFMQRNSR